MGVKGIGSRLGESEFGFKLFKVFKSSSHQSIPSENMSWTHEEQNTQEFSGAWPRGLGELNQQKWLEQPKKERWGLVFSILFSQYWSLFCLSPTSFFQVSLL